MTLKMSHIRPLILMFYIHIHMYFICRNKCGCSCAVEAVWSEPHRNYQESQVQAVTFRVIVSKFFEHFIT